MYTTVCRVTAPRSRRKLLFALFFCDPSFLFSLVCRVCWIGGGVAGGGQTNAFQSVAGFSFPPAVDEDRGRGREKGRGGN